MKFPNRYLPISTRLSNRKVASFLVLTIAFGFTQYVNTKKTGLVWLRKNQAAYKTGGGNFDQVTRYANTIALKAKIDDDKSNTNTLRVAFFPPSGTTQDQIIRLDTTYAKQLSAPSQLTFFRFPSPAEGADSSMMQPETIVYTEISPVLQTIAIPIKYRFKLDDKTPYAVSANFNAGVAYGIKFTKNKYRRLYIPDENATSSTPINARKTQFSFTPALFFGFTPIDLAPENTNMVVSAKRSVLSGTLGLIGVVGIDRFNAGVSFGFDSALGQEGKSWLYNKKPWLGIALSVELIK